MVKTINASSGLSFLLLMFLWSSMPAIGRQHESQSLDAKKRITLFASASEEKSDRDELAADLHFFDHPDRIKQYRQVQINNQLKHAHGVQINDTLILDLFSGIQVEAWVKRVESNVNGSFIVTASLVEQPGFIVLSTTGSRTLGSLFIVGSDRFFNIISDPVTFDHFLIDVDASHHFTKGHSPPIVPPLNTFDTVAQNRIHSTLTEKSLGPDDPATITVMIVYTEDASGWATENGGGVENVIALSMAIAQEVIDNSDVGITMKLVHSAKVDYVETGITLVDLARFAASPERPSSEEYFMGHYIPGYMDEIHQWRNDHKADLCALFTLTGSGAMGYLLNTSNGLPARAFSRSPIQVVATGFTHIHELGHNMGCDHNVDHPNSPGPTDWLNWPQNTWSAAWRWWNADDVSYCSVMSGHFPDDEPVWQTPFFSNPSVFHQGVPTGHPEWADNARTLREIKHIIAAYRSSPLSNEADSLALVALYHSTGGPGWTNNDNWLEGPLNTWYGLTFEVFLRFVDLNDNNLTGTIPPEIGNLTSLERLYLNNNNLTGNIPPEIGNLNRLIDLDLSFNQLSGPIPPQIGTMNSLKMLRLQINRLSGPIPPEIGNLSFLVWLALSYNQLSGSIPPAFGHLTRLEGIDLDENALSGPIPEEIGQLKQLTYVSLSGNALGGTIPESFKSLNRLRFLYLRQCQLEGIIPLEFCFFDELMGIHIDLNYFDLESCAVVSCLKANERILGTGLQLNGFNLINDCPAQYKVNLHVEPEGEGTLEGEGFYTPGDDVIIRVIPSTLYQFGSWSGDSVYLADPEASEASFVMPEKDIELIAQLIRKSFVISASPNDLSLGAVSGSGVYFMGEEARLIALPEPGCHFLHWTENGDIVSVENDYVFTVKSERDLVAHFAINTYIVTSTAGEGGSIDPSGDIEVDHGQTLAFSITPDMGYHILDVIVDGISAGAVNSYTFSDIDSNHIISTLFAINEYTITATALKSGSIVPSGTIPVNYGESQVFSVIPDEGFRIAHINIDGNYINLGNDTQWNYSKGEYTFMNVTKNYTIEAGFETDDTSVFIQEDLGLTVYPNPAADWLWVELFNQSGDKLKVQLFNMQGQLISFIEVNEGWQKRGIGVHALKKGLYFLRIDGARHFPVVKVWIE